MVPGNTIKLALAFAVAAAVGWGVAVGFRADKHVETVSVVPGVAPMLVKVEGTSVVP